MASYDILGNIAVIKAEGKTKKEKLKQAKEAREQGNPMVLEWKRAAKHKGRAGQRNPGKFIVYNLRDLMEGPKKNYEQQ